MKTIAPAFIKAKREFLPATKDKTNPAFRSKYADLGACFDAVDDAMLNNGIAIYQETFEDDSGVTVETVFLHESGEVMRGGKLHVPAAKQDPQGYGSALTYARRYSLMTACGIAPEDDDGNAATTAHKAAPATPTVKPMTESEVEDCRTVMADCEDLTQLQAIFAAAYNRADKPQKAVLKTAYDKRKAALTQGQPA
jgi:hypothetical protein